MSESSLAPQVVRQFTEKGMTLGTAESLTAGLIAGRCWRCATGRSIRRI